MRKIFVGHLLDIAVAIISYLAARWFLDMSTPAKDWKAFQRWWPFPELKWYRGPEYFHQLRGSRILSQAV